MAKPEDFKYESAAVIAAALISRTDFIRRKSVGDLEAQYREVSAEAWLLANILNETVDESEVATD